MIRKNMCLRDVLEYRTLDYMFQEKELGLVECEIRSRDTVIKLLSGCRSEYN